MSQFGENGQIVSAQHWSQLRNKTTFQLRGMEGMMKHIMGHQTVTSEEKARIKAMLEYLETITDEFVTQESRHKSRTMCLGKERD
jgi:hypothetical protein